MSMQQFTCDRCAQQHPINRAHVQFHKNGSTYAYCPDCTDIVRTYTKGKQWNN